MLTKPGAAACKDNASIHTCWWPLCYHRGGHPLRKKLAESKTEQSKEREGDVRKKKTIQPGRISIERRAWKFKWAKEADSEDSKEGS